MAVKLLNKMCMWISVLLMGCVNWTGYCTAFFALGQVELENLPLKKTALKSLDLPIEVKSGWFVFGFRLFAACTAEWFGISAIKYLLVGVSGVRFVYVWI